MAQTQFIGGIVGMGGMPIVGNILYVGNGTEGASTRPSSNGKDPRHPFASVKLALAKTIANRGDVIRVLPGHVETVSAADGWADLVAGTTIEGVGWGHQRGIIRWTAAAATILLNVAGVTLRNLRMEMAGDPAATTALTVAAPITVSAAGCRIAECDIDVGVDADQIVTVAITTTASGDDLVIEDNFIHGAAAAEITAAGTVIRLVGADRCVIRRNYISAALATDTDGLIETLTTASVDIDISDNYLYSSGAGSTCVLDFGAAVACRGRVKSNLLVVDADATAGTVVITVNAANNLALLDNFLVNDNNERGLVIGTASI